MGNVDFSSDIKIKNHQIMTTTAAERAANLGKSIFFISNLRSITNNHINLLLVPICLAANKPFHITKCLTIKFKNCNIFGYGYWKKEYFDGI